MKVATSQEQHIIHQAIEVAALDSFDSSMDALESETPMETSYISEQLPIFRDPDFDAQTEYAANARTNGRHPEINRLETKFGIKIVSVLTSERVNRHAKTTFLCDRGDTLEADVSDEAVRSVENVRVVPIPNTGQYVVYDEGMNIGVIVDPDKGTCGCKEENCRHIRAVRSARPSARRETQRDERMPPLVTTSPFGRWVGGDYPVEAPIELALWKSENKDKLAECCICGRTLTNPISVALQIGPECRKQITTKGNAFIEDGTVTDELVRTSQVYSNEKHRSWIIRACLTFEACEPPSEILHWRGEEYFGRKKRPFLYYHDATGTLHVIEIRRRKLNHRIINSLSTCETELDAHAWRISNEMKAETTTSNGKRLEMDKELKTWLVENGGRKEISCREICLEYDGKFVTRLRAEIDGGADRAIIELA